MEKLEVIGATMNNMPTNIFFNRSTCVSMRYEKQFIYFYARDVRVGSPCSNRVKATMHFVQSNNGLTI